MTKYFFLLAIVFSFQASYAKDKIQPLKGGRYSYFEKGYKCRIMMGTEVESPVDSYGFEGTKLCHYGNACNDGIECIDFPKDLDLSKDGKQLKINGRVFTFTPNKTK